MNVDSAAVALVRKFGAAELAEAMGTSVALINAKLNPNNDRNVLTLRDAMRMTDVSGDLRILQAWAAAENCRVVPVESAEPTDLVSAILEHSEHTGAFSQAIRMATADGVITPNEMKEIEKAGGNLQGVLMRLLRQLNGMQPATSGGA